MDPEKMLRKESIEGLTPLLQVFDMPSSLHFYRDLLGFSIHQSSGAGDDSDWVWLKMNGCDLMLNTAYEIKARPPFPDQLRKSVHFDITLYFGYPDIDGLFAYLSGEGVSLGAPLITGYGWKAISFQDPDGYQLCFHHPVE